MGTLLFGVFIALNILDAILTKKGLDTGDVYEANPLMSWAIGRLGFWPGILLTKSIMAIIVAVVAFKYGYTILLWIGIGLMIVVCTNNIIVLKKLS